MYLPDSHAMPCHATPADFRGQGRAGGSRMIAISRCAAFNGQLQRAHRCPLQRPPARAAAPGPCRAGWRGGGDNGRPFRRPGWRWGGHPCTGSRYCKRPPVAVKNDGAAVMYERCSAKLPERCCMPQEASARGARALSPPASTLLGPRCERWCAVSCNSAKATWFDGLRVPAWGICLHWARRPNNERTPSSPGIASLPPALRRPPSALTARAAAGVLFSGFSPSFVVSCKARLAGTWSARRSAPDSVPPPPANRARASWELASCSAPTPCLLHSGLTASSGLAEPIAAGPQLHSCLLRRCCPTLCCWPRSSNRPAAPPVHAGVLAVQQRNQP